MVQLNIVLWWPLNQRCLGNCNIERQFLDHLVHTETCILPFHNPCDLIFTVKPRFSSFKYGNGSGLSCFTLIATLTESDQNAKSWTSLELSCWWKKSCTTSDAPKGPDSIKPTFGTENRIFLVKDDGLQISQMLDKAWALEIQPSIHGARFGGRGLPGGVQASGLL